MSHALCKGPSKHYQSVTILPSMLYFVHGETEAQEK